MSIQTLRKKYRSIKKNKSSIKLLMLELLQNSSADYTTERMAHHLYKCGMSAANEGLLYKWLLELEQEGKVIFVGHKPIYINENKTYIGTDPVFGLII